MSTDEFVKLTKAPCIIMQYPVCDACGVEVDHDGDGWNCPSCGTIWDSNSGEETPGTLFEEWSGEELSAKAIDPDDWEAILKRRGEIKRSVVA